MQYMLVTSRANTCPTDRIMALGGGGRGGRGGGGGGGGGGGRGGGHLRVPRLHVVIMTGATYSQGEPMERISKVIRTPSTAAAISLRVGRGKWQG